MEVVHTPVMLKETLEFLSPLNEEYEQNAFMIDANLGEGGHTNAFLNKYPTLKVLGIDADKSILEVAKERLSCYKDRISLLHAWSDEFFDSYKEEKKPDIVLFDLGISYYHYKKSGRGFSYMNDEALDMRLNQGVGESASDIVNTYTQKALADLLFNYGQERYARRIASAIVTARDTAPIYSAKQLESIIYNAVPAVYKRGVLPPATKTFQALRIEVNMELERLPDAILKAFSCLRQGGKIGVITFHSLEDRIVKVIFRALCKACACPITTSVCDCGGQPCAKPLFTKAKVPTLEEISRNPPSHSAKFRAIRKLHDINDKRLFYIKQEV